MLLVAACGDDAAMPNEDAGTPDAEPDADIDMTPAPPEPPAAPHMDECPPGWAHAGEDGWVHCAPWPAGLPSCSPGEARSPGDSTCVSIDAPCGGDDFPATTPTGTIFVRSGAAAGDGTRARPFGTLAEAASAASSGARIQLAPGDYLDAEAVVIPSRVTVEGACAGETHVGAVVVSGPGVEVSRVTLGGTGARGVNVLGGGVLRLSHTYVADATSVGVGCDAATVHLTDVAFGDVIPHPTRGTAAGLLAQSCDVVLERVWFDGAPTAIRVTGRDSTLMVRDLAVRGAHPELAAVSAASGVAADFARVVIDGTEGVPFGIIEADSATVDWLLIRDTRESVTGFDANFIATDSTLTHFASIDSGAGGIAGLDEMTLTLEDFVVHVADDTPRDPDPSLITDVAMHTGSRLVAARGVLAHGHGSGLTVNKTVGMNHIEDVAIGPRDASIGLMAIGAEAEIARLRVERARTAGAAIVRSSIEASDLAILGTETLLGDGIGLSIDDSTVHAARVIVERSTDAAILAQDFTLATFEDLVVRDTESEPTSGGYGRGIGVQLGATVTLERTTIDASREVALIAIGEVGTSIYGHAVTIRDVRPSACGDSTCADRPGGTGVGVYGEATVELEDFTIEGAPLCGAQIADLGGLTLRRGQVRRNGIAVCLQRDGFPVELLMDNVAYLNNEQPLVATQLPIPAPQTRDEAVPE